MRLGKKRNKTYQVTKQFLDEYRSLPRLQNRLKYKIYKTTILRNTDIKKSRYVFSSDEMQL